MVSYISRPIVRDFTASLPLLDPWSGRNIQTWFKCSGKSQFCGLLAAISPNHSAILMFFHSPRRIWAPCAPDSTCSNHSKSRDNPSPSPLPFSRNLRFVSCSVFEVNRSCQSLFMQMISHLSNLYQALSDVSCKFCMLWDLLCVHGIYKRFGGAMICDTVLLEGIRGVYNNVCMSEVSATIVATAPTKCASM